MRATHLKFSTICPIFYIPCYQLGVLVCQWFEIIFQFSHSFFSVLKRFSFFQCRQSQRWQTDKLYGRFWFSVGKCDLTLCLAVWAGNHIIMLIEIVPIIIRRKANITKQPLFFLFCFFKSFSIPSIKPLNASSCFGETLIGFAFNSPE